jgi:hypothetical protein
MEIQIVLANQLAKIQVYRSSETIPTGESLSRLTLDVPKRIADVLKVESDAALQ